MTARLDLASERRRGTWPRQPDVMPATTLNRLPKSSARTQNARRASRRNSRASVSQTQILPRAFDARAQPIPSPDQANSRPPTPKIRELTLAQIAPTPPASSAASPLAPALNRARRRSRIRDQGRPNRRRRRPSAKPKSYPLAPREPSAGARGASREAPRPESPSSRRTLPRRLITRPRIGRSAATRRPRIARSAALSAPRIARSAATSCTRAVARRRSIGGISPPPACPPAPDMARHYRR